MLKKAVLIWACVCICIFSKHATAQETISPEGMNMLHLMEDSLVHTADSMYNSNIPDTRFFYHYQFLRQLKKALMVPFSYNYSFSKLDAKINIMYPQDKSFRIFNWEIVPNEQTRHYSGAIQLPGEKMKVFPLIDYAPELTKGNEDTVLTTPKWYGCLYYKIIENMMGETKVYTLMGLNAANPLSNKKILDPLTITPTGAVFGAPIFAVPNEVSRTNRVNRFIIEYKKDVQASMNWDDELKAIFFDKLVSQTNDPVRKYTYVPSGQYDGFRWENDMWSYKPNLITPMELKDNEAPHEAPLKKETKKGR